MPIVSNSLRSPTDSSPSSYASTPDNTESSPILKEIIDNSHIIDLQQTSQPSLNMESKTLTGNILNPYECAKFIIVTDKTEEIIHFGFNIISKCGFVHTAHVESILDNRVNLVVNNLSNKVVDFSLQYLSFHK